MWFEPSSVRGPVFLGAMVSLRVWTRRPQVLRVERVLTRHSETVPIPAWWAGSHLLGSCDRKWCWKRSRSQLLACLNAYGENLLRIRCHGQLIDLGGEELAQLILRNSINDRDAGDLVDIPGEVADKLAPLLRRLSIPGLPNLSIAAALLKRTDHL